MVNSFRQEIRRIVGAFIFFCRIPLPYGWYSEGTTHSSRYFSLVGCFIGAACSLVWILTQMLFSSSLWTSTDGAVTISVLLGMIVAVLLTGAIHEDGFADTLDGLGGGWTVEERLRIMKDSRLGTYGSLGLLFIVLLKFFALLQIETEILPWVWFAGHALSRFVSISHLRFLSYVGDTSKSKSRTMIEFSRFDFFVNAIFGLLPLIFIENRVWVGLLVVAFISWLSLVYFKRKLGGVTGDCLGATQQLSEVFFYLSMGLNFWI